MHKIAKWGKQKERMNELEVKIIERTKYKQQI